MRGNERGKAPALARRLGDEFEIKINMVLRRLRIEEKKLGKERIHALYRLKKGDCKNMKYLTGKIPRSGNTISVRIKKYETGGMNLLPEINSSPGRKPVLSDDIMMKLKEKLYDTEGYGSYNEIHKQAESEAGKK